MKLHIALLGLALLGIAAAESGPRVFTNTDGKRISAELVESDGTMVTLKIEGTRIARIPMASLSAEDQAYVAKWVEDRLPPLKVTPTFVRANRNLDTGGKKNKGGQQAQVLNLSVEIVNEDKTRALEECEVRYMLVGRSLEAQGVYKVLAVQTAEFSLDPAEKTTVPFKEVQNQYKDDNQRASGHRLVGYVLQIKRKRDGREAYLHSESPILVKSASLIATLPQGTETDDSFIPPKEEPKKKKKKGQDQDGPIIVR